MLQLLAISSAVFPAGVPSPVLIRGGRNQTCRVTEGCLDILQGRSICFQSFVSFFCSSLENFQEKLRGKNVEQDCVSQLAVRTKSLALIFGVDRLLQVMWIESDFFCIFLHWEEGRVSISSFKRLHTKTIKNVGFNDTTN